MPSRADVRRLPIVLPAAAILGGCGLGRMTFRGGDAGTGGPGDAAIDVPMAVDTGVDSPSAPDAACTGGMPCTIPSQPCRTGTTRCGDAGVLCVLDTNLADEASCGAGLSCCAGECVDETDRIDNCGVCGHSCEGQPCISGFCLPIPLAKNISAQYIAADDTNVYAMELKATGTLLSIPIAGGAVSTLVKPTQSGPMAVDATSVYWIAGRQILKVATT